MVRQLWRVSMNEAPVVTEGSRVREPLIFSARRAQMGRAQAGAFAEIGWCGEGLEQIFALVFGDAWAGVGHDELVAFAPRLR